MTSNQSLASFLQGYEISGDDTGSQNNLHDRIPLPPRLDEEVFDSADTVIEFIKNFAQDYGYAVSKRCSKRAKNGHIKTIYVKCSRGGEYQDRVIERTRQGSTILTDCPFSIVLQLQEDDTWLVDIRERRHNHDPSPISTHSAHRHRQVLEHTTQIEAQLKNGIDTRHIIASLVKEGGDSIGIKNRDIYYFRRDMRKRFLDGREPIHVLLSSFPETSDWVINYQTYKDTITAVFLTHKSCLDLLRLYNTVLFLDSTYKTNKYRMPLLDIVGCTGANKAFWVGFGFVRNEKEESYLFILRSLEQVISRIGLGHPKTIITDKDQALINAIEAIFPYTHTILCIWLIQKNLMVKCRPTLRQEVIRIDYEGKYIKGTLVNEFTEKVEARWVNFWQDFMKIINAYTEEEKDAEWNNLRAKYSHNVWDTAFDYIKDEWLQEDTSRHFLKCYTNEYLHLNKQASSQVEGAHWIIKRDLGSSTMDLLGATRSIEMTIENHHRKIWHEIEDERVRVKTDFKNIRLFKYVIKKVSSYALKMTYDILRRYLPEAPQTHS